MNTLNIDLEIRDGSSDCFVTVFLDLRAEYDRRGKLKAFRRICNQRDRV